MACFVFGLFVVGFLGWWFAQWIHARSRFGYTRWPTEAERMRW